MLFTYAFYKGINFYVRIEVTSTEVISLLWLKFTKYFIDFERKNS